MYIDRMIEQSIKDMAESFPCIVIYGARQVGKSTTVHHLFGDQYRYVTLDDIDDRTLALENPKLFLESYPWPVVIDEIQKAPVLLDEIKKFIDREKLKWLEENKKQTLMYILTGSNRFELQEGISDSLAGRCGVIEMSSFVNCEKHHCPVMPFTPEYKEMLKREKNAKMNYLSQHQIFENIFQGGMPDVVTGNADRNLYYASYIETYIEKDVKKLIAAASETQFRNFLSIIALRTAQEVHYDEISNMIGIDTRTCKKWISILQTSGIIYLLQPYMANISNRIIKAPKLYFMDTGLCAYLCKWPNVEMLENGAMSGAFFETYVVTEIIKNCYAFHKNPNDYVFYYRDTNQKEIDLLYIDMNTIYPIEIKKSTSPKNPTKNFNVLQKYHLEIGTGIVIDNCDKVRMINENAYYYPVYLLGC